MTRPVLAAIAGLLLMVAGTEAGCGYIEALSWHEHRADRQDLVKAVDALNVATSKILYVPTMDLSDLGQGRGKR